MAKEFCNILCSCGCDDGLVARKLDGIVYISFVSSDFYTKQCSFNKLKFAMRLFAGKKILKDIMVSKEDLINFRDFLLSAEYEEDEETNNESHISLEYDKDFGYMLFLVSDMNPNHALKFHNHRLFEITLSKRERDTLVRKINKCIKNEKTYISIQ